MSRDVDAFIRQMSRLPFVWGQHDCALMLADWWMYMHSSSRDPASHLRGTYSSEEECCRVLEDRGGLLRTVRRIAISVGGVRVEHPLAGDVSVLRLLGRHWCAVMSSSGRWIMKTGSGVSSPERSAVRIAACWRIS